MYSFCDREEESYEEEEEEKEKEEEDRGRGEFHPHVCVESFQLTSCEEV